MNAKQDNITEDNITDKVKLLIELTHAVGDTIRELRSIPSGHLYAQLMSYMSLEAYQVIIDSLKLAGVVKEENHLLTWIGGDK